MRIQFDKAISRLDELGDVVDGQMDSEEAIELLSALFTHPSNIQDSMEYIKETAPEDVLQIDRPNGIKSVAS